VLEIGTGSGYQAAVLAMLGAKVFSVERHASLARRAREVLDELEISGVELSIGDGSRGWPQQAPFDGILVTAAAPSVPEALLEQLADPGRLVAPVGNRHLQSLVVVRRENGEDLPEEGCACRFVPLLGEGGFAGEE
jgi:protein-L-isoaspartate(D-aspartate) O-methyltransferase